MQSNVVKDPHKKIPRGGEAVDGKVNPLRKRVNGNARGERADAHRFVFGPLSSSKCTISAPRRNMEEE